MCRRKVRDLGARLMRTRALSVCLGERSYIVRPLDRPVGRPSRGCAAFFKKPYRLSHEFEDEATDSLLEADPLSVIVPDCMLYLECAGNTSGWFRVEERADILGTRVPLHVKDFDVFVTRGSLFGPSNSLGLCRNDAGELCRRREMSFSGGFHVGAG